MNILLAGFKGSTNSAKILLDKICQEYAIDKLYLENDFSICKEQLEQAFKIKNYDYIIAFGQKPVIKALYIETTGRGTDGECKTDFNYSGLKTHLENNGYRVKISNNAGTYLCNHIYYCGLDYIAKSSLSTQMIFIHIPYLRNIQDINKMVEAFTVYIDELKSSNI